MLLMKKRSSSDSAESDSQGSKVPRIRSDLHFVLQGQSKGCFSYPSVRGICERLSNGLSTWEQLYNGRLPDDTFEMLVMAQYNVARHGAWRRLR